MTPPSAESVWKTVAAHSACVCDSVTFGDLPCLVHARVAAEVWITAKGLVCTHTRGIEMRGFGGGGEVGTAYEFLSADIAAGFNEGVELTNIRGWYGLPLSVRFYAGRWYPHRGTGLTFPKLEDVLIHTGNFR